MSELSPEHQKFVDLLFENRGNVAKAAEEAGFNRMYGYKLVSMLREKIIEQAESILALHAPRAAFTLADGIDGDAPAPTNPLRVDCAKQILDRVGIVKKEKVEIDSTKNVGIFILPAKRDD